MRHKTLMVLALVFGAGALSACGGDKTADEGDQAAQEAADSETSADENTETSENGETPDVIGDELEDGVEEAEDMVKDPESDED